MEDDPYDLRRFLAAQGPAFERAAGELRAGQKTTHWIWYIFPQIDGLGSSPTAQRFSIKSLEEAAAYLDHEVLGPRLRLCVRIVCDHAGSRSANDIFGSPDDLKFRSCLTLFERAAADEEDRSLFADALDRFYGGERDEKTLKRI